MNSTTASSSYATVNESGDDYDHNNYNCDIDDGDDDDDERLGRLLEM